MKDFSKDFARNPVEPINSKLESLKTLIEALEQGFSASSPIRALVEAIAEGLHSLAFKLLESEDLEVHDSEYRVKWNDSSTIFLPRKTQVRDDQPLDSFKDENPSIWPGTGRGMTSYEVSPLGNPDLGSKIKIPDRSRTAENLPDIVEIMARALDFLSGHPNVDLGSFLINDLKRSQGVSSPKPNSVSKKPNEKAAWFWMRRKQSRKRNRSEITKK